MSKDDLTSLYHDLDEAHLALERQEAIGRMLESQREASDPQYRIQKIMRKIKAAGGTSSTPSNFRVLKVSDLAPLIRKARKGMKMNQQAFADAAGVGRRFLSELENGKSSLEFDKVLACALAAGIDITAKPRRPL